MLMFLLTCLISSILVKQNIWEFQSIILYQLLLVKNSSFLRIKVISKVSFLTEIYKSPSKYFQMYHSNCIISVKNKAVFEYK